MSFESATADGTVRRRIAAFAIDFALVAVAIASPVRRRTDSTRRRVAATAVLAGLLGFPYHVLLEGRYGQTVGKRICRLAVVDTDGRTCTYRAATVRTVGRFVDALPVGYLLGLVSIVLSDRDQRIGDRLAGTAVVRTDRDATARDEDADGVDRPSGKPQNQACSSR